MSHFVFPCPCTGSHHVFIWSGTYSSVEPTDGLPCSCGTVFYESREILSWACTCIGDEECVVCKNSRLIIPEVDKNG